MAGFDLPVKLRRGLGKGNIVPAEELAQRLKPYDGDGDGALTRGELARFLEESHVGGPWFTGMLAATLWKLAENRFQKAVESIQADALGRVLNFVMARAPGPERRYVLSPEAINGYEPLRTLEGGDPYSSKQAPLVNAPAAAPTAPGVPARPRASAPGPRPEPSRAAPSPAARAVVRRPGPRPRT